MLKYFQLDDVRVVGTVTPAPKAARTCFQGSSGAAYRLQGRMIQRQGLPMASNDWKRDIPPSSEITTLGSNILVMPFEGGDA